MQKLEAKLDWDSDSEKPEKPVKISKKKQRFQKTVVLKHMFTNQELIDEPELILDIPESIREECEKIGPVTSVQLFDNEEDGVVCVRFKNQQDANKCIEMNQGRWYAKRQIEASIFDGTKYKKSKEEVESSDDELH